MLPLHVTFGLEIEKKISSPRDPSLPTLNPPTLSSLVLSKWWSLSCKGSDSSGNRLGLEVPKANKKSHPLPKSLSLGKDRRWVPCPVLGAPWKGGGTCSQR